MSGKRIYLSPPHMSGLEEQFIQEAFKTNWIAPLGPNVDAFERELSERVGIGHAAALSSGTAAIHLALELLGVQQGDIVFCSTLTFVASANPILYQGAEPVFIDSEPETWNMSPIALKKAFQAAEQENKLPKAVIVVNLYGQSADMDAILAVCNQYDVPVIEDAAESLGATYKERSSGTIGKFGIYSFNGNKIITTSGGGMLVSEDGEAIDRARFLATQARDQALHYQHSNKGYNYRMSNILAGIGRGQLRVLDERIEARREIFKRYKKDLKHIDGIQFMPEATFGRSTRWLTVMTVDPNKTGVTRTQIIEALSKEDIETRPVWKPLHMQPLFDDCMIYSHYEDENLAERLFKHGLCLPSGSSMSLEQQKRVIGVIKDLIQ